MSLETSQAQALRALPKMQRLLESDGAAALGARYGRGRLVSALREVLEVERQEILARGGRTAGAEALLEAAGDRLERGLSLKRVINAAGVVLHTNLGRAPLPRAAVEAVAEAAGYCALEYDLESGRRGRRGAGAEALLAERLGAEEGLVVNNAAAAVLLALSALAGGGEVIVSRGELVEIGGGFRIPDVIAQGGARLVEVGATNRTRIEDYRAAVTDQTRVLLKVHPSNYRMVGFTCEAALAELSDLARERNLLLVHDVGAGALVDLARFGLPGEASPKASLEAGADLVAFSGDKLLGGPQAGLIAGRAAALAPLRRHPLARALRPDKMTLAALEAVLDLYADEERAVAEIPVLRQFAQTPQSLRTRGERLQALLAGKGLACGLETSTARVGGGAAPGVELESVALVLPPEGSAAAALARALRCGDPAVAARLVREQVRLDLFAVADEDLEPLADAVVGALPRPDAGPR